MRLQSPLSPLSGKRVSEVLGGEQAPRSLLASTIDSEWVFDGASRLGSSPSATATLVLLMWVLLEVSTTTA